MGNDLSCGCHRTKDSVDIPNLSIATTELQINSLNAQFFQHQNNSSLESILISGEQKEKVEIFLSLIDTNSSEKNVYGILVGFQTKKGIESLGTRISKKGGEKNIIFDKSFIMHYFFGKKQNLVITLFINDKREIQIETSLAKIMGAKGHFTQDVKLKDGFIGKLCVNGNPVKTDDYDLSLLIQTDFTNVYRPYFIIKRCIELGSETKWINAYKSEVNINYDEDKNFHQVSLGTQFLCNTDTSKPILIEFYDFNNTHKYIGEVMLPIDKLSKNGGGIFLKDKDKKELSENQLFVTANITKKYHFLDFIRGGVQISMMIGIDFTGSNGDPHNKNSLHSLVKRPNLYERAIDATCSIVAYYDSDQLFPVYGYGAILKGSSKVSHCFNLNQKEDPNIYTVQAILECYQNFIKNVNLYGPTHFGPIIRKSSLAARETVKSGGVYHILLLLTDGIINDMQDTMDAIVEASFLPMSIIIIGIGPGSEETGFSEMDCLDGDEVPLVNSRKLRCARDIVQFVEFAKYNNDATILAEKVLEEVPKQVVDYYKMIDQAPGEPIVKTELDILEIK